MCSRGGGCCVLGNEQSSYVQGKELLRCSSGCWVLKDDPAAISLSRSAVVCCWVCPADYISCVSSLPAHDHVLLGMQISKRETFGKPVAYHSTERPKHATIKNQLQLFLCAAPLLRSALK